MYLRLVFIHLWLTLSARPGLRSHVFGRGGVWTSGVGGCERLAMGPAGATSQISLVRRGNVAGSAGQVGSTASAGWVGSTASVTGLVWLGGAASWARQADAASWGAGPTSSSVRGRGQVLVDACCL